MVKKVDADDISCVEKKSKLNLLRILFLGVLTYIGVMVYNKSNNPEPKEQKPVSIYSTLESALSDSLPKYEYSSVVIDDKPGLYDQVYLKTFFLGYVHDDAQVILQNEKEVGYLLAGSLYNSAGKRAGKLISSNTGYDILSFENKPLGKLSGKNIVSLDGIVLGTIASKTAIILDSSENITGIITRYDYSRANK